MRQHEIRDRVWKRDGKSVFIREKFTLFGYYRVFRILTGSIVHCNVRFISITIKQLFLTCINKGICSSLYAANCLQSCFLNLIIDAKQMRLQQKNSA